MIDAPLALAFTAGLVAAFNPCGFAMLPAYLGYFVGAEGDAPAPSGPAGVVRALAVGGVVSSGFVLVFGAVGLAVVEFSLGIQDYLPWLTLIIGLALIPLGIAMIRGFEPKVSIPRLQRGGDTRELSSMFLFGVSYAVVSLSCTLPVFLAAVAGTFRSSNLASGMVVFFAYALGMALVLMVLTIALALARGGVVRHMRRVLPYVNRASGVLLAVAGAYVAWYGWFEIRINRGEVDATAGPVDWVLSWSSTIQERVTSFGAVRLGLILGGLIVAAVALSMLWSDRPDSEPHR